VLVITQYVLLQRPLTDAAQRNRHYGGFFVSALCFFSSLFSIPPDFLAVAIE